MVLATLQITTFFPDIVVFDRTKCGYLSLGYDPFGCTCLRRLNTILLIYRFVKIYFGKYLSMDHLQCVLLIMSDWRLQCYWLELGNK